MSTVCIIKKYIANNPEKAYRPTRYIASVALARAFLNLTLTTKILPGLTPARDFERGRVEVSFPARLGGFGSDTPISCDPL